MAVRLRITMSEATCRRLRRQVPPGRINAFIARAVRRQLPPESGPLDDAYRAASREAWRRELEAEWAATDGDQGPVVAPVSE